jgi:hypothetical protein
VDVKFCETLHCSHEILVSLDESYSHRWQSVGKVVRYLCRDPFHVFTALIRGTK